MTVRAIRRRPALVPAVHYDGSNQSEVEAFVAAAHGADAAPAHGLTTRLADDRLQIWNRHDGQWLGVDPGCWVLAGSAAGDVYPLHPDEFAEAYELADPDAAPTGAAWARMEALEA